jgi:ubiquinone biosynthesis protein
VELSMRSQDLVALNTNLQKLQKRAVAAIAGVGLLIVAAVLYGMQPGGWYFGDAPVWSWVSGAAGLFSLASAWWRR